MRQTNPALEIDDVSARFRPKVQACLDLVQVHSRITTGCSDIYRGHEITQTQYYMLRILAEAGDAGLPMLDISDRLPTHGSDITRLVARMQRARFVRSQRLESDRRVVMVSPTERGWRVIEAIEPRLEQIYRQRLAHMKGEDRDLLADLLRRACSGAEGSCREC